MRENRGRWAIIGHQSDPFASESAKYINRAGPYTTRTFEGNIEFSLKSSYYSNNVFIHTTKFYNSNNYKELGDKLPGFSSQIADFRGFILSDEQLAKLEKKVAERKSYRGFDIIRKLIFLSHISNLKKPFNTIIGPQFFKLYPNGRVLFSFAKKDVNIALATLRTIGAAIDIFDRSYTQIKPYGSLKMLTNVQNAGVFSPGKYFSIPLVIFSPALYGFTASQTVDSFIFILGNKIPEIREPYPSNGLDFLRADASPLFAESKNIPLEELSTEKIDNLSLIDREFSQNELTNFIRQFNSKLNRSLVYFFNPGNFVENKSRNWASLQQYQAWLTFDRLADEVILMLTDQYDYLRKLSLFRILDQLSSLNGKSHSDQALFFKQLLFPIQSRDPISEGLNEYKGNIGSYLKQRVKEVRQKMVDSVLEGMYVKNRYDKKHRMVRISNSNQISEEQYVVNTIRELRNTYHGYYTRDFMKYLAINTGSIPDSLPLLGALAYFAFIAKPELFMNIFWD